MCGIVGATSNDGEPIASLIINGLNMIQHRGQDSTGIYTLDKDTFHSQKGIGLVNDVYTKDNIQHLTGKMGIGHVRYSTAGSISLEETQPLYINSPYRIALAHNGNLTNIEELRYILQKNNHTINTDSDSELLLNIFSLELQKKNNKLDIKESLFDAIRNVMKICQGSFSALLLIHEVGMIAFRDSYGIRPILYGIKQNNSDNPNYLFASESVVLDNSNYLLVRDLHPGECIYINPQNELFSKILIQERPSPRICLFEYIYFARADSIMDGILVYQARINMGEKLAYKMKSCHSDIINDIDSVMPVPETSRAAALCVASILEKPFRDGFIKNSYSTRTFIMPEQKIRKKSLRMKFNTIKSEFFGRNVLIIDDSIVRGNTSIQLIQMAREAGAKKVYFGSLAPPIRYRNLYGIDLPNTNDLVAHNKKEDEIAELLGADRVFFNDLECVVNSCKTLNPKIEVFETSCFDNFYLPNFLTVKN